MPESVPFLWSPPQATLTADPSLLGWGATLGDISLAGTGSLHESLMQINVLEFLAVSKAINHWTVLLSGKVVLVETDSTTVVSCIKGQGGTHSTDICFKAWHLWNHCIITRHLLDASECPRECESRGGCSQPVGSLFPEWHTTC